MDNAKEWADKILSKDIIRNSEACSELKRSGYDIKTEAKKLEEWYLNTYNQIKDN